MTTGSPATRPSWVRITLLVALGATLGVAFTEAGHFAAKRCLAKVAPPPDVRCPLFIDVARGSDSRYAELWRAFRDLDADGVGLDELAHDEDAPMPERVVQRLAGIDGWSTAVLFESKSSAGELRDAGLADTTTCVELACPIVIHHHAGPLGQPADDPHRHWSLVLLDDDNRQVGRVSLTTERPGFVAYYVGGERVYMHSDEAPAGDDCPSVLVFHRTAGGAVLPG